MSQKIVLTGVKPTGSPHLGNYLGAIKPAIKLANSEAYRSFFFIADFHALTSIHDPKEFKQLVYEVAATWLAFGLDTSKVTIYLQSDIPEIFKLSWILSCFTPKGLMNRAHAYKAAIAENQQKGETDLDAGINMGLYSYPILMSADILLFNTDFVPVGRDQVQHVEIARDIAGYFNQKYGHVLKLPEYVVNENTAVLPGLDGRKMSKSYNNTIPLFAPPNKLRKLINSIKTDSTPPEAPKDPATSTLFQMYKEFASHEQTEAMRDRYQKGISWGEAKQELFEVVNAFLDGPRAIYEQLMADKSEIDHVLSAGAQRARAIAGPNLEEICKAVGAR